MRKLLKKALVFFSVVGILPIWSVRSQNPSATPQKAARSKAVEAKPAERRAEHLSSEIQQIVREISAERIKTDITKLVGFYTRQTLSDTESPTRGIGAARNWIKSEFDRYSKDSGGRLQVEFDEFTQPPGPRSPNPVKVVNVVATLPGTQDESKDRMYVVSGHYDSRVTNVMDSKSFAPGADDDASGTAGVMEMARVMSRHKFDATIVFMTVAGEEQGLYGSTHWAETAKQKNLDIEGMINNDIIGSSHAEDGHIDADHVRLFAEGVASVAEMSPELRTRLRTGGENDSLACELGRKIKETADQYVPNMHVTMIYRRDRFLRGGDHSPFLDRGYAAVRMCEPNEIYQHQHQDVRKENGVQYGDLPQFDDFNYIAQVTRVDAASLASLALAPAPPKKVEVETLKLENNTGLKWEANKEPDLAGYVVVWRDPTAPHWQHRRFVGNVTGYTVKGLSKDNYIFGVEAVDKQGNASQAVYPVPEMPQRQQRQRSAQ